MSKTPGEIRREALYELFSKNWELLREIVKPFPFRGEKLDGYLCPLCIKTYDINGLSEEYIDHLTLEDVPPKKLGGSVKLLTCKICNNEHGSKLDKHLKEELLFKDFAEGNTNVKREARFLVDGKWNLGGTIENSENGGFKMTPIEQISHSEHYQHLFKKGGADVNKIDFNISSGFIKRRPLIAKLRIAYLWMVSEFGYSCLLEGPMHEIRKQIQNPNKTIFKNFGVIDADYPDYAEGIYMLTKPKELKSFAVAFKLKTDQTTRKFVVLLPGPRKSEHSIDKALYRLGKNKKRINFDLTKLNLDGVLTDKKRVLDYYRYWDSL